MREVRHHISNKAILIPDACDSIWVDDFTKRWRKHEHSTNTKLLELIQRTPPQSCIVDAGSHVGDTGMFLAKELYDSKIDSKVIEIDPDMSKLEFINQCSEENQLQHHIKTIHCGLGDTKTGASLNKKIHAGGWWITHGNDFNIVPLDDIIPSDANVYLIKLDVEGYEINALRGAINTIKRCRPLIMVEVEPFQLKRFGGNKDQLDVFFSTHGYSKIWWSDKRGDLDILYGPTK